MCAYCCTRIINLYFASYTIHFLAAYMPSHFKPFYRVITSRLLFTLLYVACSSCSSPRPDEIPVHISLASSYVDSQYVSLKVNSTPIYGKMWKRRYHQDTQCRMPNKRLTIHSCIGSQDTLFTLDPGHQPVYVSIIYSRWHHRFVVQRHDSSSYWQFGAGSNDMVEYDANGKIIMD